MLPSSNTPHANGVTSGTIAAVAEEVTTAQSQLTEEEMTRFLRWRSWGTPAARGRQIKTLVLVAILGAGGGAILGKILETDRVLWEVPVLLAGLLPLVVATTSWRNAGILAKAVREQAPYLYSPTTWTLREEGVLVQNDGAAAVREWRSIREIVVTHEWVVLELSTAQALVVPRSGFATPAAAQKFASVARELWEAARNRVTDPPTAEALTAALGADRVQTHYDLKQGDLDWLFRHATLVYFRRRPLRVLLLLILTVLMSGLCAWLGGRRGEGGAWIAGAIPVVLVPFLLLFLKPLLQARFYAGTPGQLGPHEVWASERGMIGYTPDAGISRTDWSAYSRVRRAGEYLVFERGVGVNSCFPLRGQAPGTINQILSWHERGASLTPAPLEKANQSAPPG